VAGKLHGAAQFAEGSLRLGPGAFVSFENRSELDLAVGFSVQCWVRIEQESQMPVVLAAGEFNRAGWFVQRFGRGWRWHLGGTSCDGGRPVVGRWTQLTGTFDGARACLYQDGRLVASTACSPNLAPWSGPLVVGQYARQGPSYQVEGRIADVKIFRRALGPAEIAENVKKRPRS